jgi:hypothetical protein
LTIVVTVRIEATLEQIRLAEEREPGVYDTIIELARTHGMTAHRRVYRDGEIMDIDEWPSEEARARFRAEAKPLVERLRRARGSAPSTSATWYTDPEALSSAAAE